MSAEPQPLGSGDGTRPTTSGGVDNIGAGERMGGKASPGADHNRAPAAPERMREKRSDLESLRQDDSAPFGIRQSDEVEPNTESGPEHQK